ncbi:MAG: hypothetical protein IKD18_03240 [Clostridia bacterium]|nr:hypothetical protein [Clostridia bacterium]
MKAFCDVHLHNYLSSCSPDRTATAEKVILKAAELGLKRICFTNHIWDERVEGANGMYRKHNLAFCMQIKTQIPADTHGVDVLVGAETEYCGRSKTLGMSAEGAKELDFLLIPHSHVHMANFVMDDPAPIAAARENLKNQLLAIPGITEAQASAWVAPLRLPALQPFFTQPMEDLAGYLARFLTDSFESLLEHPELHKILKLIPVAIAHPFQPVAYTKYTEEILAGIEDSVFRRLFGKAAEMGVGMEINPCCNAPQMLRMLKLAKDCGCLFTLGSDAHSPSTMEDIFKTEPVTEILGITEKDLMPFLTR